MAHPPIAAPLQAGARPGAFARKLREAMREAGFRPHLRAWRGGLPLLPEQEKSAIAMAKRPHFHGDFRLAGREGGLA